MDRFYSQCNKKIGLVEDNFDGICKKCYERNQEERMRRIEQERKKKNYSLKFKKD